MSDRSTQTTAAGAERGVRREPKEHHISGMCASSTRRSPLGALAFVCALAGSIAVHASRFRDCAAAIGAARASTPSTFEIAAASRHSLV
jgi:hypothetical protein